MVNIIIDTLSIYIFFLVNVITSPFDSSSL